MTLERAIRIAADSHEGQVDKAGKPYILHPIRVMLKGNSIESQIVGVLHDVLEDSSTTQEQLRQEGFSPEIVAAVVALTRKKGEDYQQFIARLEPNHLAKQVKIADLQDNLDRSRLGTISPNDENRIAKYQKALEFLSTQQK